MTRYQTLLRKALEKMTDSRELSFTREVLDHPEQHLSEILKGWSFYRRRQRYQQQIEAFRRQEQDRQIRPWSTPVQARYHYYDDDSRCTRSWSTLLHLCPADSVSQITRQLTQRWGFHSEAQYVFLNSSWDPIPETTAEEMGWLRSRTIDYRLTLPPFTHLILTPTPSLEKVWTSDLQHLGRYVCDECYQRSSERDYYFYPQTNWHFCDQCFPQIARIYRTQFQEETPRLIPARQTLTETWRQIHHWNQQTQHTLARWKKKFQSLPVLKTGTPYLGSPETRGIPKKDERITIKP